MTGLELIWLLGAGRLRILIEIEKCDFLWQNTRKMRKSRVRVFMILLDILKGYVIEEISSMRDRRK